MNAKVLCVALVVFCGASAQQRIVGGSPADIRQYSYVASILYQTPGENQHTPRCAAALISSWHALTSAFCFEDEQVANFVVRAGSASVLSGGLTSRLRGLLKHSGYVPIPRQNDIALVYLQTPFATGSLVTAVLLPPQNHFVADGTEGIVAGWGFDNEASQGGVQLNSLQTVTLDKVSQEACVAAYGDDSNVDVNDSAFCFSGASSGICSGDDGAPLTSLVFGRQDVLVGIASYYRSCGSAAYPDVFTRVDRFTDWIMANAVAPQQ